MSSLSEKTIIGITGGIASGKSIISNHLLDLGYTIIDTDVIVKNMYQNNDFIDGVSKVLNKDIKVNDQVDYQLIRQLIFNDNELKNRLEEYIHPLVKEEVIKQIESNNNNLDNLIFVVVPLLFEANFDDICDYILIIMTSINNATNRVMTRDNIDESLAKKIIESQMSNEDKLAKVLGSEKILILENNSVKQDLIDELEDYILKYQEKRK